MTHLYCRQMVTLHSFYFYTHIFIHIFMLRLQGFSKKILHNYIKPNELFLQKTLQAFSTYNSVDERTQTIHYKTEVLQNHIMDYIAAVLLNFWYHPLKIKQKANMRLTKMCKDSFPLFTSLIDAVSPCLLPTRRIVSCAQSLYLLFGIVFVTILRKRILVIFWIGSIDTLIIRLRPL